MRTDDQKCLDGTGRMKLLRKRQIEPLLVIEAKLWSIQD